MSSKIAQYRIDEVANKLTAPWVLKKQELEQELQQKLLKFVLANLPVEVLDFFEKYPNRVKKQGSFYFSENPKDRYGDCHYVDLSEVPLLTEDNTLLREMISQNEDFCKNLCRVSQEIKSTEKTRAQTRNKIVCTLEKLKTVPRIKAEFPEAYELLMDESKTSDSKGEQLCDSVESLRATLSSIKKPTKS